MGTKLVKSLCKVYVLLLAHDLNPLNRAFKKQKAPWYLAHVTCDTRLVCVHSLEEVSELGIYCLLDAILYLHG